MAIFVKTILSLMLLSSFLIFVKATGSCYAAPDFYGPKCDDTQQTFGGSTVSYTITPRENAGTMICCKVKGYKNNVETWFDIGCSGAYTLSQTVPWGNSLGYKGVQCKGIPFGCFVEF
uniref:Transmembrane protein n=1 Tax=Panagrolaimus sp. PS1159 TaxID=55785 RepID=A0AC35GMR1_9BILA